MHEATVRWQARGGFTGGNYSRAHSWHFDGGAVMYASSSPAVVPLPFSDPAGVDPEEALIASAAACHMLWFLSLAHGAGLDIVSYTDRATGTIGKDERGRTAITRITLLPEIVFNDRQPSQAELDRLHHQAHERCFIANSLRSEIVVGSR